MKTTHRHRLGTTSHHFPWGYLAAAFIVFSLGHWIGTQVLQAMHRAFPTLEERPLLLAVLALICLAGFSWLLQKAHHHWLRPRKFRERVPQFLLAVGVLVSAFVAASSLEHWLVHGPLHLAEQSGLFTTGAFLALMVAERWFHRLQIQLEQPRDIRPQLHLREGDTGEAIEALILFVSVPTPGIQWQFEEVGQAAHHAIVTLRDGRAVVLRGGGNPREDIEALNGGLWNWQQLLRAIVGHPSLKHLILLGSHTEKGSFVHLESCARFLKPYLPKDCELALHEEPLDFTKFNDLVDALRGILFKKLDRLSKSRIAIDVTGGQVTASVAGAAATMNLDCVFQYVNTNEPFDLKVYDVVHETGPHLH
ncbi:MAG: hypothetical protein AB7I98_08265 [Verrucomicrobiales bacterium]|nr:hypothetical protein [Verrucomicrobiae bacterium]MCP5555399.1 hypothetical protein [Akkermansiaceae bacterium]